MGLRHLNMHLYTLCMRVCGLGGVGVGGDRFAAYIFNHMQFLLTCFFSITNEKQHLPQVLIIQPTTRVR